MSTYISENNLIDKASNTGIIITYPHAAVHRDIIVRATKNFAAASTPINILFKTPVGTEAHLEFAILGGADCDVFMYEGPTVSTEGTDMVKARLLRSSTKTILGTAKFGGTVSAKGTLINEGYNGGGGSGSGTHGGSVVHDDAEWVTKEDTWYLIEIVRAASGKVNVSLEWYEVPPIT